MMLGGAPYLGRSSGPLNTIFTARSLETKPSDAGVAKGWGLQEMNITSHGATRVDPRNREGPERERSYRDGAGLHLWTPGTAYESILHNALCSPVTGSAAICREYGARRRRYITYTGENTALSLYYFLYKAATSYKNHLDWGWGFA